MGADSHGSAGDYANNDRSAQVMSEAEQELERGFYWVKKEAWHCWSIGKLDEKSQWQYIGTASFMNQIPHEIGPRIPQYTDTL